MSRYRLIQAEQADYPVAILCRVLGVARAQADAELAAQIAPPRAADPGSGGGMRACRYVTQDIQRRDGMRCDISPCSG